ncbi:MAG: hypothetical protein AAF824_24840 [Bacteroidota bacterium]
MAELQEKKHKLPYQDFLDELNELEGVTLVIGKEGKPKAIQIELLAKYEDLFEDFFDAALVRESRKEHKGAITLEEFENQLKEEGKL